MLSVDLTEKSKTIGETTRRLATYEYWNGKQKTTEKAFITLVGFSKQAEALSQLTEQSVVAEGRLNLSDVKDSKDKRLELVVSRLHF